MPALQARKKNGAGTAAPRAVSVWNASARECAPYGITENAAQDIDDDRNRQRLKGHIRLLSGPKMFGPLRGLLSLGTNEANGRMVIIAPGFRACKTDI